MLQITNMDDGKPEWNVNETHIIIPMIDGDVITKDTDRIAASTITLNALEGGDQTILTNGLEHSFVIGLDRNLFETHANKSDLLVIQNSDLKLLSCGSDLKNPVAYTLSYVDQDRSEILWESPVLKERSKPEWCPSEKTIFEVKDVLNYDESKNWRDELEKSGEQINLDDVGDELTSHVTKIDGEILMPLEETIAGGKKPDVERDAHFIVNYYPAVQNCEAISILPSATLTKPVNVIQNSISKNDLNENKSSCINAEVNIVPKPSVQFEESPPTAGSNEFVQYETEVKGALSDEPNDTKDCIVRGDGVSRTLPEKSLPLKKKAKMKRTMVLSGSNNQRSLVKHDPIVDAQPELIKSERKMKHSSGENDSSDSDEPLIKKVTKRKKGEKVNKGAQEEEQGGKSVEAVESMQLQDGRAADFTDSNEPKDIFDLVEGLRKCRLINASVWQTLNSGLKELNADILKEMNAKREEEGPGESPSYSPQLKAFALVLYFKQPAAFNHLAKVYRNGWPSLNVIKDWKRRMNSHQRPDFVGVRREIVSKT